MFFQDRDNKSKKESWPSESEVIKWIESSYVIGANQTGVIRVLLLGSKDIKEPKNLLNALVLPPYRISEKDLSVVTDMLWKKEYSSYLFIGTDLTPTCAIRLPDFEDKDKTNNLVKSFLGVFSSPPSDTPQQAPAISSEEKTLRHLKYVARHEGGHCGRNQRLYWSNAKKTNHENALAEFEADFIGLLLNSLEEIRSDQEYGIFRVLQTLREHRKIRINEETHSLGAVAANRVNQVLSPKLLLANEDEIRRILLNQVQDVTQNYVELKENKSGKNLLQEISTEYPGVNQLIQQAIKKQVEKRNSQKNVK
jgi:hypothetical protein